MAFSTGSLTLMWQWKPVKRGIRRALFPELPGYILSCLALMWMKEIARIGRSKVWNRHRGRGLILLQSIFVSLHPFVFLCWLHWSSKGGFKCNYPWSQTMISFSSWLGKGPAWALQCQLPDGAVPWAPTHAGAQMCLVWHGCSHTLAMAKAQQALGSSLRLATCSSGHVDTVWGGFMSSTDGWKQHQWCQSCLVLLLLEQWCTRFWDSWQVTASVPGCILCQEPLEVLSGTALTIRGT